MRLEVHSAADFLMNLIRVKRAEKTVSENQLEHFKGSLQSLLVLRFRSHWYPDVPTKGSGYRCIRINGKMDPIVEQAGVAVGLPAPTLRKMLPTELTLWIDPEEVSYRIGENGSICVLYDSQSRTSPSSDIESNGSGTTSSGSEEFIMERIAKFDMADLHIFDFFDDKAAMNGNGLQNHGGSTTTTPVKANGGLDNSLGSDDQYSPPMSPSYQFYQSHHMAAAQRLNGNFGSRSSPSDSFIKAQAYGNNWDSFGNNNIQPPHHHHSNATNKVRTQC